MGQPANARLTPEIARDVCERTGSAAVVEGSIDSLGSKYVLGVNAKNCRTGDILYDEQIQAERKEDLPTALTQIAGRFRARAGESLATIKQHSAPLAEATTPSLEALKAYSTGKVMTGTSGAPTALPFLRRAVAIDPNFATAYATLGMTYGAVGDLGLARENATKAWDLRDRASDHERFNIEFIYQRIATGNLEKARQICELWGQAYPRDVSPHSYLAGGVLLGLGRYDRAEEEGKKAIELDPDNGYGYHNLANSYILRNRPDEAQAVLKRASDRNLNIHEFLGLRHQIAFLKDDKAEMERLDALAEDRTGTEDWLCEMAASVLAYYGHWQQARIKARRAVDLAMGTGHPEAASQHEAGAAVREFFFGYPAEARRAASAALAYSKNRDAEAGTALALEFGWQGAGTAGFAGSLYPIYVRGEAYMAGHKGPEAAAEFQKIIAHIGVVSNDPTIVVAARLQLARAFALAGDRSRAKKAYDDFLNLWKDADPDIPILNESRAEYAKLQ
jgi:eukaryotic-like serine/threonine-protein kinase